MCDRLLSRDPEWKRVSKNRKHSELQQKSAQDWKLKLQLKRQQENKPNAEQKSKLRLKPGERKS